MNSRTTLVLLVLVALCGVGYWLVSARRGASDGKPAEVTNLAEGVERRLVEEADYGDWTKIICRPADRPAWIFEASKEEDGRKVWRMAEPETFKAVSYKVDRIARQLMNLRYDTAFDPKKGEKTLEDTGLSKPSVVIDLTDDGGKTVSLEFGRGVGRDQTYVRLAGRDQIILAGINASTLIEKTIADYRDLEMIACKPTDIERVEIEDRTNEEAGPIHYVLVRDEDQWIFEEPFRGKTTEKVQNMVDALAGLRATKWQADRPESLLAYGLQAPALTLTLTIQSPPKEDPKKKAADEKSGEAKEPGSENDNVEKAENSGETDQAEEKVLSAPPRVVTLQVSDVRPLGKETELYARLAEEPWVASISTAITDKLKPVETEWRDMRITTRRLNKTNSITITVQGLQLQLENKGGDWRVGGGKDMDAEDEAVRQLINSVTELQARGFVDLEPGAESKYGLDKPQAEIRFSISGEDDPESIFVGGTADEKTRRLLYLRRNDSNSIAKVKTDDVAALMRLPREYYSREVLALGTGVVTAVEQSIKFPFMTSPHATQLAATEPGLEASTIIGVESPRTNAQAVRKLIDTLKNLRAETFATESGEPSAYGLDAPVATLDITVIPPKQVRWVPEEGAGGESTASTVGSEGNSNSAAPEKPDGGPKDATQEQAALEQEGRQPDQEGKKLKKEEYQPANEHYLLLVGKANGHRYVQRGDSPKTPDVSEKRPEIYEISKEVFDALTVELFDSKALVFEESQVTRFSYSDSEGTAHAFEKRDDRWIYTPEADLPLKQTAVKNYLIQLASLKTPRYVEFAARDLAPYGLDRPAKKFDMGLDDGRVLTLTLSAKTVDLGEGQEAFFAAADEPRHVFVLPQSELKRVVLDLSELEE